MPEYNYFPERNNELLSLEPPSLHSRLPIPYFLGLNCKSEGKKNIANILAEFFCRNNLLNYLTVEFIFCNEEQSLLILIIQTICIFKIRTFFNSSFIKLRAGH